MAVFWIFEPFVVLQLGIPLKLHYNRITRGFCNFAVFKKKFMAKRHVLPSPPVGSPGRILATVLGNSAIETQISHISVLFIVVQEFLHTALMCTSGHAL